MKDMYIYLANASYNRTTSCTWIISLLVMPDSIYNKLLYDSLMSLFKPARASVVCTVRVILFSIIQFTRNLVELNKQKNSAVYI